jgi:nucleoside-diphosphate-sugar epimerase/predicted dehydrogenase
MPAGNIKVALLGAGYIAKWHGDALRRQRGVEISAICDLSENTARSLADAYGVEGVETSLDNLLARADVDCVHVLTPPQHHVEATRQIFNSGRAAFVEKPFALSLGDCVSLDELAKSKDVALGVNHNFLMLPSYDRLKRDISSGVIGPIDTIEANWQFPLPPLRSGPFGLWMLRKPENILFEIGPHLFAFIADLFGDLQNIDVSLRNPITIPGDVNHYQTWRISGEANGAAITINLSLIEGHDNRSVRLRGLGGYAVYDFAQDTYRLERAGLQDIVIGPLAAQLSIAGQAIQSGFSNAARQISSLNGLSPYGLSIARAIENFYSAMRENKPVDRRLSAKLAGVSVGLIERALDIARPQFSAPASSAQPANVRPANGKTALVIGGSGFIGRALVTALADQGYAVRVFSRGSGGGLERDDGRVSVTTGSLKSEDDLLQAMDGVDSVFHLAKATENSWAGYLENDVGVTRRIGEACLKAGVVRLIYTGTIDSYDASQPDRPISEATPFDHDLERRNLYARSKAACEAELKALERENKLPLVIVRPGIVIGKAGPLQHWGIAMWRGATACKLWGNGRNIMPFVLVDDVAEGLVLAAEAEGALGQSFNLIGDPMLSARDYFTEIAAANNVRMRALPTPIWTYFVTDVVKYWAKRLLAKRSGLTKPSFRDWKSRAQLSPYRNDAAKSALGWRPEADRQRFIQRGIVEANLFGVTQSRASGEGVQEDSMDTYVSTDSSQHKMKESA